MNLQEKLEQMAMTSFERRLLEHWLAAHATPAIAIVDGAEEDADEAEEPRETDATESEVPPATGTDGA